MRIVNVDKMMCAYTQNPTFSRGKGRGECGIVHTCTSFYSDLQIDVQILRAHTYDYCEKSLVKIVP